MNIGTTNLTHFFKHNYVDSKFSSFIDYFMSLEFALKLSEDKNSHTTLVDTSFNYILGYDFKKTIEFNMIIPKDGLSNGAIQVVFHSNGPKDKNQLFHVMLYDYSIDIDYNTALSYISDTVREKQRSVFTVSFKSIPNVEQVMNFHSDLINNRIMFD